MILYRILLTIAGLVAAGFAFFFVWGLADGTVSADNMLLWLVIIGVCAGVLIAATQLRAKGQNLAANLVLLILALPGLFALLFFLTLIILQPRWN